MRKTLRRWISKSTRPNSSWICGSIYKYISQSLCLPWPHSISHVQATYIAARHDALQILPRLLIHLCILLKGRSLCTYISSLVESFLSKSSLILRVGYAALPFCSLDRSLELIISFILTRRSRLGMLALRCELYRLLGNCNFHLALNASLLCYPWVRILSIDQDKLLLHKLRTHLFDHSLLLFSLRRGRLIASGPPGQADYQVLISLLSKDLSTF